MNIHEDNELTHLKQYNNNFKWYLANYDYLLNKYKNEFIAITNPKIYNNKDFNELLEILKKNNIEPAQTFIEFIG